jgi:hypothetical protein
MAYKQFVLDEHTTIKIYKHRKGRNIRLSINADGVIRVTLPSWTPYSAGLEFARSKLAWIESQRQQKRHLSDGQAIGKAHRLHLEPSAISRISTRVYSTQVVVRYPSSMSADNPAVQKSANTASIRALKQQAELLLPQRLMDLAEKHDFTYGEVKIKSLKSRWGSCDQHGNITLNLYLMLVPWEYIDYVLLHELMHTRIMQHGPVFWDALGKLLPEFKQLRKTMRQHQPALHSPLAPAVA